MSEENQTSEKTTKNAGGENSQTQPDQSVSPNVDSQSQQETSQEKPKKSTEAKSDSEIPPTDPTDNENPVEEESKVAEDLSLSKMILALPERERQNIYDTMVSYVHNKTSRDTLLHSVFQKAERAIIGEIAKKESK